jgi:hypothetical protein
MLTKEQSSTKQDEKTNERSNKRNESLQKTKKNKLRKNPLGLSVKQVSKKGGQPIAIIILTGMNVTQLMLVINNICKMI